MDHPEGRNGHSFRLFKVNGVTQSNDQYNTAVHWVNFSNGAKNPSWRQQVRNHTSATTTLNGMKFVFHYGEGSGSIKWNVIRKSDGALFQQGDLSAEGFAFLPAVPLLSLVTDPSANSVAVAMSAAKMKLLSQIRGTYRSFQGGVFLGELAETIHQIRHPAEALRKGIELYHRDVMKRFAKYIPGALTAATRRSLNKRTRVIVNNIVRKTWLEYVYGWRPLVNDVKDAMKALAFRDYREFVPLSAFAKDTSSQSFSIVGNNTMNGFPIDIGWTVRSTASCRLIGECGSEASHPGNPATNRWGFGSWKEAIPTIWELIPYSFLVDYFTNIGDMIDGACTQLAGVRWVCGTVRRENEITLDYFRFNKSLLEGLYNTENASFKTFLTGSSCSYSGYKNTCVRFDRSAWALADISLSLSDFSFRVPGVSSTRWLNIAALASRR